MFRSTERRCECSRSRCGVSLRQGVGDHLVADWRLHEVVTARHDDEVLASILLVGHRRGLAAGGELGLPHRLSAFDVDRADQIVGRGRDEDQAAGGDDGAAIVGRSDGDRQHRGNVERTVGAGFAKRPLVLAFPRDRSHDVFPVRRSMARMPP